MLGVVATPRNRCGVISIRGHGGDAKRSLGVHHRIRPDLMYSYAVRHADHESLIGYTSRCFRSLEWMCPKVFLKVLNVSPFSELSVLHGIMNR